MNEQAEDQRPLERIDALTRDYASRREQLRGCVEAVREEIDRIERQALPRIREHVRAVAETQDRLHAAIKAHPELWQGRRRTVVIAGVRVGMAKGKGRIVFDKPERVVQLIREHFPEQAEAMIRVREEPVARALAELTVAELRKIGCLVEGAQDQVVIKPTDSTVDKLVQALLRDAERIEEGANK